MSAYELAEWRAFYADHPFGETREDLRFAMLQSNYFNAKRDPKKSRRFEPRDFMPDFGGPREKTVSEQIRAVFEEEFKAKDIRDGR